MTETFNVILPLSLQRLHQRDLEVLTLAALTRDITRDDIQAIIDERITEKRAANSIVRIITNDDIEIFKGKIVLARASILPENIITLQAFVARGIVTIRYKRN